MGGHGSDDKHSAAATDASKSKVGEGKTLDKMLDEKKPPKSFGANPHKIEWGPNHYTVYTDHKSPFFYRMPKGTKNLDMPAHVPQNPMSVEVYLKDPRQRVFMTEAEREWRRKWVLDQKLHPDEPMYRSSVARNLNPFRRIYRFPMDWLAERVFYPRFGPFYGELIRSSLPKCGIAIFAVMWAWYHIKYNHKTWENCRRPDSYLRDFSLAKRHEIESKYPGIIEKAHPTPKKNSDYNDYGYSTRSVFLDVGETQRPW